MQYAITQIRILHILYTTLIAQILFRKQYTPAECLCARAETPISIGISHLVPTVRHLGPEQINFCGTGQRYDKADFHFTAEPILYGYIQSITYCTINPLFMTL